MKREGVRAARAGETARSDERLKSACIVKWHGLFEIGDDFEPEFFGLHKDVQTEVLALAHLLETFGPHLGRPRVDTLSGSRHANMKELRFDKANASASPSASAAVVLDVGASPSGSASLATAVPASAHEEMQHALRALAGHFQVHADHAEAAREIAVEPRLRAER